MTKEIHLWLKLRFFRAFSLPYFPNRAKERIHELHTRAVEAERKAAELEARLSNQKTQSDATERPEITDFDDINDYYKAVDEYQINQAIERIEQKQSAASKEKQEVQRQSEYDAAIIKIASENTDFDEAVSNMFKRQLPSPITLDELADNFGYDAEIQARLLYALGKDPELHERVSESSKLKAGRILSELVDSWESKPKPKVSKAPPPIKPVQTNAPASRSTDSLSDEEFLAQRRKNRLKG